MASPATGEVVADPESFTLQIVSPSAGVPQPLALESLPTSTTVQQLKDKIRDRLDSKPPGTHQRLIHQGHLLRDAQTMRDVFGSNLLVNNHQTVHLALRPSEDAVPQSTSTTAAPGPPRPLPPPQAQRLGQPPFYRPMSRNAPNRSGHPYQYAQFQPNNQLPVGAAPQLHPPQVHFGMQGGPVPSARHYQVVLTQPGLANSQADLQQRNLEAITNRVFENHYHHQQQLALQQRNLDALAMASRMAQQAQQAHLHFAEQQRLAHQNYLVAQNAQAHQVPSHHPHSGPQAQATMGQVPMAQVPGQIPDPARVVAMEGLGSNGQRWRVAVNEPVATNQAHRTDSPVNPGPTGPSASAPRPQSVPNGGSAPLPNSEVQNMMRAADAGYATRIMTDAMRRIASSSSVANLDLANHAAQQPIRPGVTTSFAPFHATGASAQPEGAASQTAMTPEVYILSSPNGPRGLLMNGASGIYYTPPARAVPQPTGLPTPPRSTATTSGSSVEARYGLPPTIFQRPLAHGNHTHPLQPTRPQPGDQAQAHPQQRVDVPVPVQPHARRANNPQVRAVQIAQVWPHVWMIIRLALFIWWFTSPTSSWSRWLTVVSVAAVLFILNTGLLNPLAEQVWVPLRRHLENLIPLAAEHRGARRAIAGRDGQRAGGNDADHPEAREPNPADTAARLVQQRRRDNTNWLASMARRLERAGILFIASLAPGLAERHIAQIEAEARAERQRHEAAEAAAAAAREASQNAEGNATRDGSPASAEASHNSAPSSRGTEQAGRDVNVPEEVQEPLIAP
ncbi:hypothetical protein F5Y18DRAFT_363967 [Xylariaceae sp. FL1019]|nr:hypothetical protein F5Y18DRAFT_363967 [Xylariaceae sp. FL1019]